MNTTPTAPRSAEDTLVLIRGKSDLIVKQQAKADEGRWRDMHGALGLQHLRMERAQLQRSLPPLRLVS